MASAIQSAVVLPHTFPVDDRIFGDLLDEMLRESLKNLFHDLCGCEWYVREHEVVNLFVFGHLVPLFQANKLPLTRIGIEVPVLQIASSPGMKWGARKDLVIWSEAKMTPFKCDLSGIRHLTELRGLGQKPFAVMEWKHISRFTRQPDNIRLEHQLDKQWLTDNLQGGMLRVGYAVLIDHYKHPQVTLTCHRFSEGSEEDFLNLPTKTPQV